MGGAWLRVCPGRGRRPGRPPRNKGRRYPTIPHHRGDRRRHAPAGTTAAFHHQRLRRARPFRAASLYRGVSSRSPNSRADITILLGGCGPFCVPQPPQTAPRAKAPRNHNPRVGGSSPSSGIRSDRQIRAVEPKAYGSTPGLGPARTPINALRADAAPRARPPACSRRRSRRCRTVARGGRRTGPARTPLPACSGMSLRAPLSGYPCPRGTPVSGVETTGRPAGEYLLS